MSLLKEQRVSVLFLICVECMISLPPNVTTGPASQTNWAAKF